MGNMLEQLTELAHKLHDAKVEHVFGITGSGPSLRLISTMEDLGARYHPVSHEAAAAIMAGAVGRINQEPAASVSIRGPGLVNQLPGIALNHFETAPAVSISEAMGPEVPAHRMHKRVDQHTILNPVIKARASLGQLDSVGSLLAVTTAEVPGPVHVQLCEEPSAVVTKDPTIPGDLAAETQMLEMIEQSERPVVIAGSLALRRPWGRCLADCQAPVFTTAAGKGAIDESLPQAVGVYTGSGGALAPESGLSQHADLIVGLGLRNTEVLSAKAFGIPTLIVDEIGGAYHDGFEPETVLIAPEASSFDRVLETLTRKGNATEALMPLVLSMLDILHAAGDWLPATVFSSLNELDLSYALVLDTGDFCTVGEHVWQASPERPFLGSSNSRFMGAGIPTAIGAAIARPGLPVICVVGDGGIRMYPSEIRLAVAERLPICFVLMTDGRFASVANGAGTWASKRALEIDGPSWWRSAQIFGCDSTLVSSQLEFERAMNGWGRDGPLFLETVFSPVRYARMASELR